jgi:hypothetical protein
VCREAFGMREGGLGVALGVTLGGGGRDEFGGRECGRLLKMLGESSKDEERRCNSCPWMCL